MGVQPSAQPILLSCTFRITELHYTYGCPTLIKAYVCKLYLQNHWVHFIDGCATFCATNSDYLYQENHLVTLQLWVRHLKCSLRWLPLV